MVASSTRRSSSSAQYRSHNIRNANLRNKPLLDFKQPASWKSWERSASAELDILNLLDAVTYDPPNFEWVCDNHPDMHPMHDADMLAAMLEAATSKHFTDARAAYNHLIEWVLLDSKPGLAKQVDRALAPTRDGPGLWKLILNHISMHERSQQMKAGGLWADIHARSFDLDGSKGTTSPIQEHLAADEIHDVLTGIADTWTCIVGNVEANASECIFTILRLLQRRPDIAAFARDTEREYRRMEAHAEPIDLTIALKYITDELDVHLPQLAASATGNSVFDTIFELGTNPSSLDAGASLHRMQSDRSRPGPPRRDDRTRSNPSRPDDTRGGMSRTSPHPGDGRRPRSPLNHCPFCISKLCPAKAGAKCEECIVHNVEIKTPPWASESNLRHLGIAMLYAKENPTVKSFKTIDVIDWALKRISAPMLKARRRSAGDSMLAQILEPDDDSTEDPELSELAESDALRALYDEQGTEPAFRVTSERQTNWSISSCSADVAADLSSLDQPSLDAHATALINDIDSSVAPMSSPHFEHAGRMHVLLNAGHSIDHSSALDDSPRIAMMASTGRNSPMCKGGSRPIMPSLGRGRGGPRPVTDSSVNSCANKPDADDTSSAALVAPRMSAGAKTFSQTGKQRPVNPGHYRNMFKPATSLSTAALSAMQRVSSQRSESLPPAIPHIHRYKRDDELVRVRSLSLAPAPSSAQPDHNDGSCALAEQPAYAAAPPTVSSATHDQIGSTHAALNAAAPPSVSAHAVDPAHIAHANSCISHGRHEYNPAAHDTAAQSSALSSAAACDDVLRKDLLDLHCKDLLDLHQRVDAASSAQKSLASRLDTVDMRLVNDDKANTDFRSDTIAQLAAINNRFDALTDGVTDIGALGMMQATIAALASRLEVLECPSEAVACNASACNAHANTHRIHSDTEHAALSSSLSPITDRQNLLDESMRVLDMTVGKLRIDLLAATDEIAKLHTASSSGGSAKLPDLYQVISPDIIVSRLDKLETNIAAVHTQLENKPSFTKVGAWADASDDAHHIRSLEQRCSSLETRVKSQDSDLQSLLDPSGPQFTMLDNVVKSINECHRAQSQDLSEIADRTTALESSMTNCVQRLHSHSCDLSDVQRHVTSLRARVPLSHSSPSDSESSVNLIESHVDAPSSPSTSYVPLPMPSVAADSNMSIHLAAVCYVQAHALGRIARNSYRTARLAACTLQAHARAKPWRLWASAALSERREFQIVADLHRDFTAMLRADARSLTPTRRSPRTNSGVISRYSPTASSHFQQPAMRA